MLGFMKHFLVGVICCISLTALTVKAEVPIKIMGARAKLFGNDLSIEQTLRLIRNKVLPRIDQSKFLRIQVQPIYKGHQLSDLKVYLLSKKTFSFKEMLVNVTPQMQFLSLSVENNENPPSEDPVIPPEPEEKLGVCPTDTVDFVVASPLYSDLETTRQALDNIAIMAEAKGYHVLRLFDSAATVKNYKDYLSCKNMRGFISIGHGNPEELLLDDGLLKSSYFMLLRDSQDKALANAVVEFNSCEVFNLPYSSNMINDAGVKFFIGGNTSLVIGNSERASSCFWLKALVGSHLSTAIEDCQNKFDHDDNHLGYGRDVFAIGGFARDKLSPPVFAESFKKKK